ncbi:hypothetical protein AVEN_34380-1 [Araneus ventricosus]|uniref:Uncharacterized protein n=1 Tax=Araneus ventricosus TaxID=182803 RepID=A0A4Y2G804_ARAVE|nr:hypothetical protein AVEN_34380-1 [Araneus ventricosus]
MQAHSFRMQRIKKINTEENPQISEIENLDDSYENNVVTEEQNVEKNAIVSYLQKAPVEDFEKRKSYVVNQLQFKAQNWDPAYPLPDVEEKIKALNACFDLSVALTSASYLQRAVNMKSLNHQHTSILLNNGNL